MKPLAWSAADEAEWAVLVDELVAQAWPRRGKPGFREALTEAIDVILDWRRRRELATLAVGLRARQDLEDWKGEAA